MTPTNEDKLHCAERELGFRKRVYARRVEQGKMTQAQADREIGLMAAIVDDYKRLAAGDRLL